MKHTTAPETDPRLLLVSVPEAGRRLSVGRSTVLELVASGRLGSVKVGARRLVPVIELERFVAELCAEAHITERLGARQSFGGSVDANGGQR